MDPEPTTATLDRAGIVHLFFPIERIDEEKREIRGFAFVNEVVEGEGGVRLKRTAMEEATPDYLRWGAVREMHQPQAAGSAVGVEWRDGGAFISARIVDDVAWKKVKEGVYKGLSVGVNPRLMRGKDVEKCVWVETSLVDRPKDPDAVITCWRAEGVAADLAAGDVGAGVAEEVEAEEQAAEVLVEEPEVGAEAAPEAEEAEERAQTSASVPARENLEPKGDTHYNCGVGPGMCHAHTTRGGAQECMDRQAQDRDSHISMLEDHLAGLKAKRSEELVELARAEDAEAERADKPAGDYGSHADAGYADPGYQEDGKPRYPLKQDGKLSEERVRAAWSYIRQAGNRSPYSAAELAKIEGRIRAAAEKLGIKISADERADLPVVARAEFETTLARAEAAERELATVRGDLTAARERVAVLEAEPALETRPPVRYAAALARTLAGQEADEARTETLAALDTEWERLQTEAREAVDSKDEPRKMDLARQVSDWKRRRAEAGAA